jgi:N-methylhydantoinase A
VIRVATDVGGTFTDVVAVDEESLQVTVAKADTTPRDVVTGVLAAVNKLNVDPGEVSLFVHGSTVATNLVVQEKGSRTALITTRGFRDVLEIRRINRPDERIYDLFWKKPLPLVPRYLRFEIGERTRFDGQVLTAVDEADVLGVVDAIRREGVEAVALCLLHSYVNPSNEVTVAAILARELPGVAVSASHEVAREIREYERTSTTVIDAYVKRQVVDYLGRLGTGLTDTGVHAPLMIANSSGGVSSVQMISHAPINMVSSGPAGAAVGAAYLGGVLGLDNLVVADVGGTSFDVSLVMDGEPRLATETDILGYVARLRTIDVRSVGAGGGSIARVDAAGMLHVGPESAGAEPGPMCFGRGGAEPTVTDAALVSGLLDPDLFAGGEQRLDVDLAHRGIQELAQRLRLDVQACAEGVLTVAQNRMAQTVRQILIGQGYDPRDFTLVTAGGGGGLFCAELARAVGVRHLLVPAYPSVFSAWGMLGADIVGNAAHTLVSTTDRLDPREVERVYSGMETSLAALVATAGGPGGDLLYTRSVDTRYKGQGREVEVPLGASPLDGNLQTLIDGRFDELHRVRYGHRMDLLRETVTFRLQAVRSIQRLRLSAVEPGSGAAGALLGRRPVHLGGAIVACPVYDRERIGAGDRIEGPAIVQEPTHTTVIAAGDGLDVDAFGNLRITIGGVE